MAKGKMNYFAKRQGDGRGVAANSDASIRAFLLILGQSPVLITSLLSRGSSLAGRKPHSPECRVYRHDPAFRRNAVTARDSLSHIRIWQTRGWRRADEIAKNVKTERPRSHKNPNAASQQGEHHDTVFCKARSLQSSSPSPAPLRPTAQGCKRKTAQHRELWLERLLPPRHDRTSTPESDYSRDHRWSSRYWNSRYGCDVLLQLVDRCYFYFYAPAGCYYPVSSIETVPNPRRRSTVPGSGSRPQGLPVAPIAPLPSVVQVNQNTK